MSTQDNGGPAFPGTKPVYRMGFRTEETEPVNGMTLRDYLMASADIPWEVAANVVYRQNGNQNGTLLQIMEKRAEMRLQQADAMLKARQA